MMKLNEWQQKLIRKGLVDIAFGPDWKYSIEEKQEVKNLLMHAGTMNIVFMEVDEDEEQVY